MMRQYASEGKSFRGIAHAGLQSPADSLARPSTGAFLPGLHLANGLRSRPTGSERSDKLPVPVIGYELGSDSRPMGSRFERFTRLAYNRRLTSSGTPPVRPTDAPVPTEGQPL